MGEGRITYRNLGEIFVIEIDDTNIEVGTIDFGYDDSVEGNLTPFNRYVIIRNLYKYPDRVREYAEACQFTNYHSIVNRAPLLRTFAPISNVITEVVLPALCESFGRNIVQRPANAAIGFTEFSYHDPKSIEFHKYDEPHVDSVSNFFQFLPLHSEFKFKTPGPQKSDDKILAMAGVIYLDETFGTEILVNKNVSFYRSENTGIWGAPEWNETSNDNYYPEGSNSHYESRIVIGGEYNSAAFYYGSVSHRPHYSGATEEDLKRGRLVQNIWIDDVTNVSPN